MENEVYIELTEQQKTLLDYTGHCEGYSPMFLLWENTGRQITGADIEGVKRLFESHEALHVSFEQLAEVVYPMQKVNSAPAPILLIEPTVDGIEDVAGICKHYRESNTGRVLFLSISRPCDKCYFYLQLPSFAADLYTLLTLCVSIESLVRNGANNRSAIVSYSQYCAWQNDTLSETPAEIKEWQQSKLRKKINYTKLPTEKNASIHNTADFAVSAATVISPEVVKIIRDLAQAYDVSTTVIWQGIFCCLLRDTSDADYVSYRALLNGRVYEELLDTLALIDSYGPVCIKWAAFETLEDLVHTIDTALKEHNSVAEYYTNNFLKKLIAEECNYSLQYVLLPEVLNDCVDWQALIPGSVLQLDIAEGTDKLSIRWTYSKSHFEASAIQQIDDILQCLLKNIVNNPDYLVQKNKLVTGVYFNEDLNFPVSDDFVALFERQCKLNAAQIAIADGEDVWTYARLEKESNRLANYLINVREIKVNDIVAIHCERSAEIILTILAVLKSGAAFLPIDTSQPLTRIKDILQNAAPKLVITDQRIIDESVVTVNIIDLVKQKEQFPNDNYSPVPPITNQLAYVIYTSGTTGKPKGCMLTRRNLAHYLNWCRNSYFKNDTAGNFGWFTPLSFDLTITSIFSPLAMGKQITVIDPKLAIDEALKTCFGGNSKIDTIKLTPSHINVLQTLNINFSKVKVIIAGGEALQSAQVAALFRLNPAITIYNEYGPTEATVGCIVKQIENSNDKITIGRSIIGMHAFIVNELGERLLPGLSGEIYLAGAGIALGYLNNAVQTSEKFFTPEWSQGYPVYKTGDLGRVLENGEIDFLGRIDHQVKIRGYRIEVNEVLYYLKSLAHIKDAHVGVIRKNNDSELAAFYVSDVPISEDMLRSQMRELLPPYMVPTYFYAVSFIHLTVNGKIDEQRILLEALANKGNQTSHEDPSNEIETIIADFWKELLQLSSVSRHDDFFKLGGQSIKAALLVARIRKQLSVNVNLKDIFERRVLSEQAAMIKKLSHATFEEPVVLPPQMDYEVAGAQWRIWTAHYFRENSIAYNMPSAYLIDGPFDKDNFCRAFTLLIGSFEVLRTRFVIKQNGLRQIVHTPGDFVYEFNDLSTSQNPDLDFLCSQHAAVHIDLSQIPLYRANLVKLGKAKWFFLLNIHHIVIDGLSEQILMDELIRYYNLIADKRDIEIQPSRFQYKEYAAWQNRLIEAQINSESQLYWATQMSGELPLFQFVAPGKSAVGRKYLSSSTTRKFEPEFTFRLRRFAAENNSSLFTLLITLVEVLLYRYTGAEEWVFGIPVDNRQHEVFEKQPGLFLNTILLRNKIIPGAPIRELIATISESLIAGMTHGHYPFELVVRDLREKNKNIDQNVFNVLINLQERPNKSVFESNGLRFTKLPIINTHSKVDLAFNFSVNDNELEIDLDYSTDLFSGEFVEQFLRHWEFLTEQLIKGSRTTPAAIAIMPDAELEQLVRFGHGKHALLDPCANIYSQFKIAAVSHRDKLAVVSGTSKLTYRELKSKVDHLSGYLKHELKIKEGDIVAVLASKNHATIEILLALFQCNAVYLPVDVSYPAKRIALILNECCAANILNASGKEIRIDGYKILEVPEILPDYPEPESSSTGLDAPAYMIFTSGSTGKPKGVLIPHGGFVNMINAQIEGFGITQSDNCLWFSSPSFDASLSEIFLALHTGATLFVSDADNVNNQHFFANWVARNNITVATLPPAYLSTLPDIPPGFRILISAGEALSPEVASRVTSTCRLFNAYGPSENSVCTTFYEVKRGDVIIPIGRPVANVSVKVVNNNGTMTPIGVAGEIHISGPGLSIGYFNNDSLTAESFYFENGIRWYRTGDWGMWHANGMLVFSGRKDQQLKIRGNRVELGDIKSFLLQMAGVKDVAVIFNNDRDIHGTLIAYIVLTSETQYAVEELKASCKSGLPAYMIPDFFLFIDQIPLNENGKTDVTRLPDPSIGSASQSGEIASKEEETIAALFSAVLKTEHINRESDFFMAGGHSLAVIQLISAIYRTTFVNISFSEIYQYPLVKELAKLLKSKPKLIENITGISEAGTQWQLATPMQQNIFADSEIDSGTKYLMAGLLKLTGTVDKDIFMKALNTIILKQESLRYQFRLGQDGVEFMVLNEPRDQVFYYDYNLPERSNINIADSIKGLLLVPVDPMVDPLCKLVLISKGNTEWYLVFMLHHLIGDGWSVKILLSSIFNYYNRFVGHLQEDDRIHSYAAFAQSLAKVKPRIPLRMANTEVTLFKIGATKSKESGSLEIHFEKNIKGNVQYLSRLYGISPLSLLSGLQMLSMMHYSGQHSLTVFTPLHGRYESRWHDTIGLFMNILPFEMNMVKTETVQGLLDKIHCQYIHFTKPEFLNEYWMQRMPSSADKKDNSKAIVQIELDDSEMHYSAEGISIPDVEITSLSAEGLEMVRKFDLEYHYKINDHALSVVCIYDPCVFTEVLLNNFIFKTEQMVNCLILQPHISFEGLMKLLDTESKRKMQSNQLASFNKIFKNK